MAESRTNGAPEPPDEHLESLITMTLARYGEHIPEGGHDRLREAIKGLRETVAALYAYPLTNADEPDATFAAWQGED